MTSNQTAMPELPELPHPLEIEWPQLNPHALGCGVEDRGIRDRYEAAEYGWQDGVDKAAECVPEDLYTAEQMRAYARAAIQALSQQSEPVAKYSALLAAAPASPAPIDMILHCPKCGLQHVDEPEDAEVDHGHVHSAGWSNPPHRSHLCHGCGHIWRPADVPTNGVAAIKTKGKNDSPASPAQAPASVGDEREAFEAWFIREKIPNIHWAGAQLGWQARAALSTPLPLAQIHPNEPSLSQSGEPKAQPLSIEAERADFEHWYVCRYKEPIGSDECARQWSAWLARSGGFYKAPSDWKISPQPWGRTDAASAQQVEAAQAPGKREQRFAKDCNAETFSQSDVDGYVRFLAWAVWRDHYRETSPNFVLLSETLGVLTQLDNMLTGWKEQDQAHDPTEEMLVAGLKEMDVLGELIDWNPEKGDCATRDDMRRIYKAMQDARTTQDTATGDGREGA